jgi:hypothetical protein
MKSKLVKESLSDLGHVKEGDIFRVWIEKEGSSVEAIALGDDSDDMVEFEIIEDGPLKGERGVAEKETYYHNNNRFWIGHI